MAPVGENMVARRGIPHLRGLVKASRDDVLAIRRPSYLMYTIGMTSVGENIAAGGSIPHLYCLVTAPGGDAPAIKRPSYRNHIFRMPMIDEDVTTVCRIPYLHRLIPGARGNAFAIWRPRHRPDIIEMTRVGQECGSWKRCGRCRRDRWHRRYMHARARGEIQPDDSYSSGSQYYQSQDNGAPGNGPFRRLKTP